VSIKLFEFKPGKGKKKKQDSKKERPNPGGLQKKKHGEIGEDMITQQ